jgi:hypothetical protein
MDSRTTKITNPKHIEDTFTADLAVKDAVAVQVVEIDPVLERKLRWKIDLYLMPALWILLVFSYIVPLDHWKTLTCILIILRTGPTLGMPG